MLEKKLLGGREIGNPGRVVVKRCPVGDQVADILPVRRGIVTDCDFDLHRITFLGVGVGTVL